MASAATSPASVELFYSYAHTDETLCRELQKHLTALKRSGLIRDWYDRKIQPGDQWGDQIQQAMERAGIILLLISADFLASSYIFDVELPFALKRHQTGSARVIPVLLRPVEWRDSPFADLQILPSEARAVTLWPNQDEAFSDIAGKLRELLYSDRLRVLAAPDSSTRETVSAQERVLDAAIASSVVIDEPTDLVTMVRRMESGGLRAILQTDRTYSPTSEDVQSETFELDFPASESGILQPATLILALESPGFDPPRQVKKIRVPPASDSGVSVFMLTPKRLGKLLVNLQAISGDIEIGSRALATMSVSKTEALPVLSYGVTSLPLTKTVPTHPVVRIKVKDLSPELRAAGPGHPQSQDPRIQSGIRLPGALKPALQAPPAPMPLALPVKRSRRTAWISIGSSAAALALVCTAVMWKGNTSSLSIASSAPPHQTQLPPASLDLHEAIKRIPNVASPHVSPWGSAMKISVARNALPPRNQLQVSFNVPEPPSPGYKFNLIQTYGYKIEAGARSSLPAGTFPPIMGSWKPGDRVNFRLQLPKELVGAPEPVYLTFCVGSTERCLPSPDILVP